MAKRKTSPRSLALHLMDENKIIYRDLANYPNANRSRGLSIRYHAAGLIGGNDYRRRLLILDFP